jgi:triphosphoribosyl-dephospho-CoA synthase
VAIADIAVWALIEEAELTPKPALVDLRGPGAHRDLDVERMRCSARALRDTFVQLYETAAAQPLSRELRDTLAGIGRAGETIMLRATGGSNAHRGAIWSLGLLVSGTAMTGGVQANRIAMSAARIARFPSRVLAGTPSNGQRVCARYGVTGARGEAQSAFPHVVQVGLPKLREGRLGGLSETEARLDALIAIMATLADTCLLHRGGEAALMAAQQGALRVLAAGGCRTPQGRDALHALDRELVTRFASPGGAADMLAAVLFLDRLEQLTGSLPWK